MTTAKNYTSFAEFKNAKAELEQMREDAIKLMGDPARQAWAEIKAREQAIEQMYHTLMPEVGMGATENLWSDHRAKTIVSVVNANTIVVAENKTKCTDYYAGEYEILDELDTRRTEVFTRRKSGRWVMKGQPDNWGSVSLTLGVRCHYIDPSF